MKSLYVGFYIQSKYNFLLVLQSNEVKNSTWVELEGLLRSVKAIQDAELETDGIITDRHKRQVENSPTSYSKYTC